MKLTSLNLTGISTPKTSTGRTSEDSRQRFNRMKALWSHKDQSILFTIGTLLKAQVSGKTMAEHLIAGEEFEMDSVVCENGAILPLQPNFKLSLKSLAIWGCPACRSAHGSGVYPSREKDAALLAENKFFYNPATKQLFTISTTCWKDYVKKVLGDDLTKHFVQVPEPTKTPTVKASAKA